MYIKKLSLLLMTIIISHTIDSAQNLDHSGAGIARFLLRSEGVDSKSQDWQKLHPIISWFWRNKNYEKPCSDPVCEKYRKHVFAIKKIHNKIDELSEQPYKDRSAFKKELDNTPGIDLIHALRASQVVANGEKYMRPLLQQLYKDVREEHRPIAVLAQYLKVCPITINDIEGFSEASCRDNGLIKKKIDSATKKIFGKKTRIPFMWRPHKDGSPKTITAGALAISMDPAKERVELYVHGKKIVSLACKEASQMAFGRDSILIVASTLTPKKERSYIDYQGALIVDLITENYILVERSCPDTSNSGEEIIPQVIYKNDLAVLNWRNSVDIFYTHTNTIVRHTTDHWIENAYVSVAGDQIITQERLSKSLKNDFFYNAIKIRLEKVLLIEHLKRAMPKKSGEEIRAEEKFDNMSGIGLGKSQCLDLDEES